MIKMNLKGEIPSPQIGLAARRWPCGRLPESARHRLHPAESAVHPCLGIETTTCTRDFRERGAGSVFNALPPKNTNTSFSVVCVEHILFFGSPAGLSISCDCTKGGGGRGLLEWDGVLDGTPPGVFLSVIISCRGRMMMMKLAIACIRLCLLLHVSSS